MRTLIFTGLIAAVALVIFTQLKSNASDITKSARQLHVQAALSATHTQDRPVFFVNESAKSDRKPAQPQAN